MKDQRLVHAAIFIIFVAVSLVYALFLDTKADEVRANLAVIMQDLGVNLVVNTGAVANTGSVESTGTLDSGLGSESTVDSGMLVKNADEDSFLKEVLGVSGSGVILTGTELYYGSLDILKTLGIRYDYILKDKTYDIFYAYIGKNVSYSVTELARAIGGKTIEIYAKNDIINNLYFGDRVIFVELPQQLPTMTNIFVRMGSDLRMIQDITGQYKQHKRHIRSVFTNQ